MLSSSLLPHFCNLTHHVRKSREVSYTEYVQKSKQVSYTDQEPYTESVIKFRPITKERDITKANVFNKYFVRELDKEKYNSEFNKSNEEIEKIRQATLDTIMKYSKGKVGVHHKDVLVSKDKFEEKYIDLLKKIQEAEYESYFAENPHNSLEELAVDIIGDIVLA